jgi:arylsulfatase A-like enzyme
MSSQGTEGPYVRPIARVVRGAIAGLAGGAIGGVLLGVGEGAVVLAGSAAKADPGVLAYGAAAYGLLGAVLGQLAGTGFSLLGQLLRRPRVPESVMCGRIAALVASVPAIGIGLFRIRRDVFHEQLALKSAQGLMVLGGTVLAALIAALVISQLVRMLVSRKPFTGLRLAWVSPVLMTVVCLAAFALSDTPEPSVALAHLDKPAAPAEAGNVLVIIVDTLRADHLPAYGYRDTKTPNLDALAQDGIVFEHMFANASWTRPSFASIVTGRYPSSHRTTLKSSSLPDEIVTLPEAMQSAGYTTLGIATNYNVAPFFNFHQGFDAYRYLEPSFVLGANDTAAKLLFVQFLRKRIETYRAKRNRVEPGSAYQDASIVNRELLAMLGDKPQTPFFAFVGYMDPHDPYYPHPYNGTGYSRAANPSPLPEEAPELVRLYNGEIEYWDQEFGKLIAELKARKLYDDLTILITSDHGEEFMDHGSYWHGTTLYDEQLRVPLLVKLPRGDRAGTRVSHWVESVDIMPTLLRQGGIAIPEGVQGKDLMKATERTFAEEDHEGNVLRAMRTRRGASELKIIEANQGNPRGLQPLELYRTDQDPKELVSLAHEEPEVLKIAATLLDQRGQAAQKGAAQTQSVDLTADGSAVEKLRALGYAGGEDDKEAATAKNP